MSAATVATANLFDGQPVWAAIPAGNVGGASYDISQTINPLGSDARYGAQRDAFWTGIGLFVAGRVLRKVAPSLHRAGLKVGKHTKVSVV